MQHVCTNEECLMNWIKSILSLQLNIISSLFVLFSFSFSLSCIILNIHVSVFIFLACKILTLFLDSTHGRKDITNPRIQRYRAHAVHILGPVFEGCKRRQTRVTNCQLRFRRDIVDVGTSNVPVASESIGRRRRFYSTPGCG